MEQAQEVEFQNELREKYLVRREFNSGTYRARTGNTHQPTPKRSKSKEGSGVRRRSYYTHIRVGR